MMRGIFLFVVKKSRFVLTIGGWHVNVEGGAGIICR